jgi:hypothetical protein
MLKWGGWFQTICLTKEKYILILAENSENMKCQTSDTLTGGGTSSRSAGGHKEHYLQPVSYSGSNNPRVAEDDVKK